MTALLSCSAAIEISIGCALKCSMRQNSRSPQPAPLDNASPLVPEFVSYELPANFLDEINSAIIRLEDALKAHAETKSIQVRVDAHNVLNHPILGNPNLNMNAATFGQMNGSDVLGNRVLQGQLRLNF